MKHRSLLIFLLCFLKLVEASEDCQEWPVCPYDFTPHFSCGQWWCYRSFPNWPIDFRNTLLIQTICNRDWPGSDPVSIHCANENTWLYKTYGIFWMGLAVPRNLPHSKENFVWLDGTLRDFESWVGAEPGNTVPKEEVTMNIGGGWHDCPTNHPVFCAEATLLVCKIKPTKVIRQCRPAADSPVALKSGCKAEPVCPEGTVPHESCGKVSCYRSIDTFPFNKRNAVDIQSFCQNTHPGSEAVSIHCQDENDWLFKTFGNFWLGLYVPRNFTWSPESFRWSDGTAFDFNGFISFEPGNQVPKEEVAIMKEGKWYDCPPNQPGYCHEAPRIVCKQKPETKITCPPEAPAKDIEMENPPIIEVPLPTKNASVRGRCLV